MEDCIFCKIIKGDISSDKVYEDEKVLAFLDINPHAKGHTVVIPKEHAATVFSVDDLGPLMNAVKKVMLVLQDKLHPDGFNVGWNHGKAGGQVVSHLHIHVFPRYQGDGGGSMHSIVNTNSKVEEVAALFEKD